MTNVEEDLSNEDFLGRPEEETFQLDEDVSNWSSRAAGKRRTYKDGSTIDWMHEEALERSREQYIQNQRGLRGIFMPLFDEWQLWIIMTATGAGVGIIGAWLDVLVAWLSDLKMGRCAYGIFYSQVSCCSGLDAGELCTQWNSWSEWFNISSIFLGSIVRSSIYIFLGICFASSAAVLVRSYAPYAFHTGIPEIKAIINGYVLNEFLSPWTLLIKALGLALAVASGLSLGKEGPLVHVSCCMAFLMTNLFAAFRHNEVRKRKCLAAAAAAGVSVAFGSPLGGVLFGLEELDLFSNENLIWRGFVTSVIASVALQWVDPFGTGKLVLFQVTASLPWRAFELIPWLTLGVLGGVLGAFFIRLNCQAAVYRQNSGVKDWPLLEVIVVTAGTAIVSYPIAFMRVQTSDLVSNLFQECDATKDYYGLCNPSQVWSTAFLLLCTAALKFVLTVWTFGMNIPAGVFLPTIGIGASLGRAVGLILQAWHRAHPKAWIFSSCPPEGACIAPGFYSVIGAAAMLGGVTRMTISLVVILFELTGALSHVLPIMIAVMASKWVGDALGKQGIYEAWIALHGYPFLSRSEFRDHGETASTYMVHADEVACVEGRRTSLHQLDTLLKSKEDDGFPVLDGEILIGYVTRDKLREAIDPLIENAGSSNIQSLFCSFIAPDNDSTLVVDSNLSSTLERAPFQLKKELPLQLVIDLFQKLNLDFVLFTSQGRFAGLMTKKDVVALVNAGFPYLGSIPDPVLKGHHREEQPGRTPDILFSDT